MVRALARSFLLLSIFVASGSRESRAETARIELAEKYVAIAMRTETGDLLAVDDRNGTAALFRADDLTAGKVEPSATLRIGDKPREVCCKVFGEKTYFAVVCQSDAHVYLLDAADFSLAKKIPLPAGAPTHVACSENPADPFVFYNFTGGNDYTYGAGGDTVCGAVDLRTMKDVGKIFGHAEETTLSSDGRYAYRKGGPSHFASPLSSLERTNPIDAESPTFRDLFNGEGAGSVYVPDPRGRYAALGPAIYGADLKTIPGRLNFVPLCFSRELPLIFARPAEPVSDQELYLQTLSYNTFSEIGEPVVVPLSKAVDLNQSQIGLVPPHPRVFADDVHDRLVVAYLGDLYLIPYADFQAPEEPLLASTFVAPETFEVGTRYEIQIKISDPRTRVIVRGIPDGLEAQADKLIWTPTDQQIGVAEFRYSLVIDELETTVVEKRKVVYPHVELPFEAYELRIDDEGSLAVAWSVDDFRSRGFGPPGSRQAPPRQRLAVADLKERKMLAETEISSRVVGLAIAKPHVLAAYDEDPLQVQVLNTSDLKRTTSLRLARPAQGIRVFGDFAIVTTVGGVEVFRLGTWEPVQTMASSAPVPGLAAATPEGLALSGVLYDESFERRLIYEPRGLTSLAPYDDALAETRYAETPRPPQSFLAGLSFGHPLTIERPIPGSSVTATAELLRVESQFKNPFGVAEPRNRLSLRFEGSVDRRITLDDSTRPPSYTPSDGTPAPRLETAPDRAVVLWENRIYPVPVESSGEPKAEAEDLSLVPRQSTFWIGEEASTVLKHEVRGAKGPVQYELRRTVEGMTIDATLGDVTLEAEALRKLAVEAFLKSSEGERIVQALAKQRVTGITLPATDPASPAAMLRRAQEFRAEAAERLSGRKSTGIPVAAPVFVAARDGEGNEATMQYFVLVEAPVDQVAAAMKAKAPSTTVVLSGPEAAARREAGPMDDSAELQRRVTSLEARVDLLTRQLEQALQKLDQLAPREAP